MLRKRYWHPVTTVVIGDPKLHNGRPYYKFSSASGDIIRSFSLTSRCLFELSEIHVTVLFIRVPFPSPCFVYILHQTEKWGRSRNLETFRNFDFAKGTGGEKSIVQYWIVIMINWSETQWYSCACKTRRGPRTRWQSFCGLKLWLEDRILRIKNGADRIAGIHHLVMSGPETVPKALTKCLAIRPLPGD